MDHLVPYLSNEAIHERAEQFLEEHAPEQSIPIDIESIVEYGLGITIQPFDGLSARFGYGGMLSSDLETIYVDADAVRSDSGHFGGNSYRKTLAHETGHRVLHSHFIQANSARTPQQWKESMLQRGSQLKSRLEYQANRFASCLLVPSTSLPVIWEESRYEVERNGLDLEEMGDYGVNLRANWSARRFMVSLEMIYSSLHRDHLVGAV